MDESLFSEMHEAIDKLFSGGSVNEEDIVSLQESIFTHIIPQFNEAIVMTDILGVTRNSLFNSINNGLVDKIKSEIENKSDKLDEKRQQKLWNKLMRSGHKFIHHPVMQPLLMHVMGRMNNVKEVYVSEILKSKELYDKTPMNVLRHVWLDNPKKLKEEVDQLIDSYVNGVVKKLHIQAEEAIFMMVSQRRKLYGNSIMSVAPYIHINIKQRKLEENIQKLVDMIGDSKVVCSNIIKLMCEKFTEGLMKKESPLMITTISTVQFDLYSRIIDKHLSRLFDDTDDELYSMISQLSSCIRVGSIDNKHMVMLAEQLEKKQHLNKELEFIFTEPFVLFTLSQSIISLTIEAGNNKKLPRENQKLLLLATLINLGLSEFDSDSSIDRNQSSSLHSSSAQSTTVPSSSSNRKRTHSIKSYDDEFDDILPTNKRCKFNGNDTIEQIVHNITPYIQTVHVSVNRDKLAKQKMKIQSNMLHRQVSESAHNKNAFVPVQYLSSSLGRLFVQYHCVWCLHKKEYSVLRLLLSVIYNSRRSDHRPTVEWRPELLQALIFGLCSIQNVNEKMMIDFLNLLRPVIPMTTVFFQLLYLVTVAALKDGPEIERLLDNFMKHPNTDVENTNLPSGKSMLELLEMLKGISKDPSLQASLGAFTPVPGAMGSSGMFTPSHSAFSGNSASPRITPSSSHPFAPMSPSVRHFANYSQNPTGLHHTQLHHANPYSNTTPNNPGSTPSSSIQFSSSANSPGSFGSPLPSSPGSNIGGVQKTFPF